MSSIFRLLFFRRVIFMRALIALLQGSHFDFRPLYFRRIIFLRARSFRVLISTLGHFTAHYKRLTFRQAALAFSTHLETRVGHHLYDYANGLVDHRLYLWVITPGAICAVADLYLLDI